ncbi:MAG: lysylphosphatidylglycerol synthase transmembrane domain-containing protein, partial [Dehalococcoidia bacterium]
MPYVRIAVGLIISCIALYLAFAGIEWSAVKAAVIESNHWLLIGALPVLFVYIVMRAQRWRLLFNSNERVPLLSAFGALNVGYLAGGVLPLQLGELVRVYVLGEVEKISKARVLSTVAVERLFDVFVLLVLLGILVPFIDLPRTVAVGAIALLCIFIVATLVVVALIMRRTQFENWLQLLARGLPKPAREPALDLGRSLLEG